MGGRAHFSPEQDGDAHPTQEWGKRRIYKIVTVTVSFSPGVGSCGGRGLSYVRRVGFEPIAEFVDISDLPTIKEAKMIFEKALKLYKDREIGEVNVVYCDFTSPVKQIPTSVKILPISRNNGKSSGCIVEPNIETVLNDSVEIYLKAKIRNILLSSKCSEQSARMTAMDGATSNANDLLESLNLKFNRIRQGMITQEINEIVGGAEAQK